MIGARALKLASGSALKERVFTEDHGVHERCLLGRPEFMNLCDEAGMNPSAPPLNAAPDKAPKLFDILRMRRPQHGDPVVPQIAFVVERARIAIVSRRMQLGSNPQPRAVDKNGRARLQSCRRCKVAGFSRRGPLATGCTRLA